MDILVQQLFSFCRTRNAEKNKKRLL